MLGFTHASPDGSNVQQDEELLFLTIIYVVLALKYIRVRLDLFFI